jgi:hypothetical protein
MSTRTTLKPEYLTSVSELRPVSSCHDEADLSFVISCHTFFEITAADRPERRGTALSLQETSDTSSPLTNNPIILHQSTRVRGEGIFNSITGLSYNKSIALRREEECTGLLAAYKLEHQTQRTCKQASLSQENASAAWGARARCASLTILTICARGVSAPTCSVFMTTLRLSPSRLEGWGKFG